MVSGRLAFAALGVACVAAAAGGSYVATRHNLASQAAPGLTAASTPPAASTQPSTPDTVAPVASTPPATASASRPGATAVSTVPNRPSAGAGATSTPRQAAPQVARVEPPPTPVEHAVADVSSPLSAPPVDASPAPRAEERPVDAPKPVEAPSPAFDELVVAADSVIGLRLENTLSSERARVEDRVEARVVRDVRVNGRVAIPAGARVQGVVTAVERGGRLRERARLGIRFTTLQLSDGTRMPISTEAIYRYGEAPGNDSAKKVGGGAVAGAILGAIIGGGKGAAIGATAGAAGGGAMVMSGERSEAVFQSGADLTARILSPVAVTVEH